MIDEESFQSGLDEDPDNFHLRRVFADWLQENNDERAAGYRALGVLCVRPYCNTDLKAKPEPGECPCLDMSLPFYVGRPWYYVKTLSIKELQTCRLPWQWWDVLKVHEPEAATAVSSHGGARNGLPDRTGATGGTSVALPFKSRREAEDAAARAFNGCPTYYRRVWSSGAMEPPSDDPVPVGPVS